MNVLYLSQASLITYSNQAINYVNINVVKIKESASLLNVSATAIAGIMAEENDAYWKKRLLNEVSDAYALSDVEGAIATAAYDVDNLTGFADFIAGKSEGARAHSAWVTLRNALPVSGAVWEALENAFPDDLNIIKKIYNPMLMDLGKANFKLITAVELIENHPEDAATLGLTQYLNEYDQLAHDLVNGLGGATEKLYALMTKEAETFFVSKNSYGDDWSGLSQVFKDALYVTYFNFGKEKMESGFNKHNERIYEPIPAFNSGGGLNHLFNAQTIGDTLGNDNYLDISLLEVTDIASLAKTEGGLAARYALYWTRPIVIDGLDYSLRNNNGELNLYDPEIGQGMTNEYIDDKSNFLGLSTQRLLGGEGILIGNENIQYTDVVTGEILDVRNSSSSDPTQLIRFGGEGLDSLHGGTADDHLYGGNGIDFLLGNRGDDYLEGNADADFMTGNEGADHLIGGSGDDVLIGNEIGVDDNAADTLEGGEGFDTYYAGAGDIVRDSDKKGQVSFFDGLKTQTLVGGIHKDEYAAGVYKTPDEEITYTLSGTTLTVESNQQSFTIEDFIVDEFGRHLNIRLQDGNANGDPETIYNVEPLNPPDQGGLSTEAYEAQYGRYAIHFSSLPLFWYSPGALLNTNDAEEIKSKGSDSIDISFLANYTIFFFTSLCL